MKPHPTLVKVLTMITLATLTVPALAQPCTPDSVEVGTVCVDKYEAGVWNIPASEKALINKVKKGKANLADLHKGGAVQMGCSDTHTVFPASFDATGNWTAPLYAVSIPGVLPTACVTWFQAEQACRLSGKRLVTNQEWQAAAASTPDGAPCNVSSGSPSQTGAAPGCVSVWGAFDMVGNLFEWTADWVPTAKACATALYSTGDMNCLVIDLSTPVTTDAPAAITRGGTFSKSADAGVFAVSGGAPVSGSFSDGGFRCAR